MTNDLINKKDKYFPSYSGSNENLNSLLNKTSQIICSWFSNSEKYGPFPIDEGFKYHMPTENANSPAFNELGAVLPVVLLILIIFVAIYLS